MLFSSLICFQGRDLSGRLLAITASCYSFLLLWLALFGVNSSAWLVILLGTPIILLSSFRRLRDAAKPNWWCISGLVPWLLTGICLSAQSTWQLWLSTMLLGILVAVGLAWFPSLSVGRFVHGYQGPASTGIFRSNAQRQRVEPSLTSSQLSESLEHQPSEDNMAFAHDASLSEQLQNTINNANVNKKPFLLAIVGGLGILVSILLATTIVSSEGETNEAGEQLKTTESVQPRIERISVTLRDGFTLSLAGEKLFMNWLGEDGAQQTLWQLANAEGDQSCQALRFNNGSTYRPMSVHRLADSSTEADFSPLDTKVILKDIARRGSVSLCGFNFSLKGSQSDLSKQAVFRKYIE
ncbi:MAG: hypothetical protein ACPGUD_07740 [Parashewanella sp.]